MNKKVILCFGLIILSVVSVACLGNTQLSNKNTGTSAVSEVISSEETGISSVIPVGLTYSMDKNGRTVATGMTAEGITVSAVILANRDINEPGEGSSYSIQFVPYSENDREIFTGDNWTLIEERSEFYTNGNPDFDGTGYIDTFKDSEDTMWTRAILPTDILVFTTRGQVFSSLATGYGEMTSSGDDLLFASSEEAFQQAEAFFNEAGFSVSDSYEVFSISKDLLDKNAKLATFYGDDMTDYNELYPNGLQTEDSAYLFYLRRDVNGMPLLSQGGATALVTEKGVEYATLSASYIVSEAIETGKMISFEEALFTVSESLFSLNIDDVLWSTIYAPYTNDPKSEELVMITPSPDGELVTYGTLNIDRAELGLLPIVGVDNESVTAIPCWEFFFVWTEDPSDPKTVTSSCWGAVNALTGEYIPAMTYGGEI